MPSVNCRYVSRKINRICWQPSHSTLKNSDTFVTGSWNDQANMVSVWQLPTGPNKDQGDDGMLEDIEPQQIYEVPHTGDVTSIKFVNKDNFVTSSSNGNIYMYSRTNLQMWKLQRKWSEVHHYPSNPCPCTALDVQNEEMVTVGEDGRIAYISIDQEKPKRVIDQADSSSLTAVDFFKQQEILTSNMRGQLKLWDARTKLDKPNTVFQLSGEPVSILCIAHHPTQPQVVATGQEDGTLLIWDTRIDKNPVSVLQAHGGAVLDVKFHPVSPNHLFSCSMDGSIWHWDGTALNEPSMGSLGPISLGGKENGPQKEARSTGNPWLTADAAKHRLDIFSLIPSNFMPINCLDVEGENLVCGSDSEALYVVSELNVL